MDIKEAFYTARKTMLEAEIPVYDRGCPLHLIDNKLDPEEGKYLFHYHVVVTGANWSEDTILHECTHSLQKMCKKPPGYNEGGRVYGTFEPEIQARFVAMIVGAGIPVTGENYSLYKMLAELEN